MLQSLTDFVVSSVEAHGVIAVFMLMLLESACIPVPAEVTMLVAGVLVARHHASFVGMVTAGVAGNLAGSLLVWWLAARGGRTLLERHGRKVGVRVNHLDAADRWFERRGRSAVLIGRCVPVVRSFISLPAGVARMPLAAFTIATIIGCIPFVALFVWLGMTLGNRWTELHHTLNLVNVAIVAMLVAGGAAWAVRVRQRRRRRVSV